MKTTCRLLASPVLAALLLAPLATLHAAGKPKPAMGGTSANMWGSNTSAKINLSVVESGATRL